MNTKKWTMRDGNKIRIKDMTSPHLENTIKMIQRNCDYLWFQFISFPFNGDAAQLQQEQSHPEDFLPEIYYDMEEELKRRNMANRIREKNGVRTRKS